MRTEILRYSLDIEVSCVWTEILRYRSAFKFHEMMAVYKSAAVLLVLQEGHFFMELAT